MATPRKHWFRVADSVRDEPWTNDQLAFLIRLMAELNTRWARNGLDWKTACSIELNGTDLMALSGKHRVDVARKSAEHLADIASMSVSHRGNITLIAWPKYAEFQGLIPRESPESRPLRNLPRKTPPQPQEDKRESAPPAPVADAPTPTRSRRVLIPKPESFDEPAKERLRAWAARKGIDRALLNLGLEEFRDWEPLKPPYRRTSEQWEGAFKKILREGIAAGKIGKSDVKPKPVYRRDDNGQVLVPNEWRGLA